MKEVSLKIKLSKSSDSNRKDGGLLKESEQKPYKLSPYTID